MSEVSRENYAQKLPRIVVVSGPTAVGKTNFSLQLAENLNGEIVNADSLQVYKYLNIGTAKVSDAERARVPHHLIDILNPDQEFNVADYKRVADEAIDDIIARGKRPIVVGGTGLYIRILVHGIFDAPKPSEALREKYREQEQEHGVEYLHAQLQEVDPVSASRVHSNDFIRITRALEIYEQTGRPLSALQEEHQFKEPSYDALKICLLRPRANLYERINQRVDAMLEEGLIDEYQSILARGYSAQLKPLRSLGYRQIGQHLLEGLDFQEAVDSIKQQTRRYAKQQLTWFRKEQGVQWVDVRQLEDVDTLNRVMSEIAQFVDAGTLALSIPRADSSM